jgi:hypothetical protein
MRASLREQHSFARSWALEPAPPSFFARASPGASIPSAAREGEELARPGASIPERSWLAHGPWSQLSLAVPSSPVVGGFPPRQPQPVTRFEATGTAHPPRQPQTVTCFEATGNAHRVLALACSRSHPLPPTVSSSRLRSPATAAAARTRSRHRRACALARFRSHVLVAISWHWSGGQGSHSRVGGGGTGGEDPRLETGDWRRKTGY